jgi:hypothetical protein
VRNKLIRSSNVIFFENERLRFDWPDEDQLEGELDEPFDPFEVPEDAQVEVEPPRALEGAQTTAGPPLLEQPNIEVQEPEQDPPGEEHSESDQEEPREASVRRGSRIRKPTKPFEQAYNAVSRPKEPRTCRQAITDPIYGTQWKAAIQDELDKLQGMMAWKVANRPTGRRIVGSKWVFKVKYTPSGRIDKFKARLVAQGFS